VVLSGVPLHSLGQPSALLVLVLAEASKIKVFGLEPFRQFSPRKSQNLVMVQRQMPMDKGRTAADGGSSSVGNHKF